MWKHVARGRSLIKCIIYNKIVTLTVEAAGKTAFKKKDFTVWWWPSGLKHI